ncbi:class A beta-lactamase [Croceicoccus mobilis]|uniref:beta-lactamase n=1 Tax=Croceicoccus mobilis TaxID=1703339 RepID=A0A916YSL4_9SPHN|nr:class A beta-lactamase [Croceicoccus mobilis]GGD58991.1 beta-lactamase [Croceicoccus mobilis]
MKARISRRDLGAVALGGLAAYATGCGPAVEAVPAASPDRGEQALAALRALDTQAGGTLGAFILDIANGENIVWQSSRRFCHCSSFKLSLAALMWREVDAGRLDPEEMLPYTRDDLMAVSPVTTRNLDESTGKGALPIRTLARAIQVTSDNAAANLLLRRLGGPKGLTAFWRSIGDDVSRLDAYEPELNRIPPGTTENSTTPEAMARTVARLTTGDVLESDSRETLRQWMADTVTGTRRLRAGVPDEWWVGDKTGTSLWPGFPSTYVDIGLMIPAGGTPLAVAAYYVTPETETEMNPESEAVLAQVGRIAADWSGS